MQPVEFCATILGELGRESTNDPWVRGAYALCQMYGSTDEHRFELIVGGLARGGDSSALAAGARWLLARWQATRARGKLPLTGPAAHGP